MADAIATTQPDPEANPAKADWYVVHFAAKWQEARYRALHAWARLDVLNKFGCEPDPPEYGPVLKEAIDARDEALDAFEQLAREQPKTITGAVQMLRIAAEVMSHKQIDPEHTINGGDMVALICQVRNALAATPDYDIRIGAKDAA